MAPHHWLPLLLPLPFRPQSNDAKAECCAYSPTLSVTAEHTPGELVSNLTTSVVLGRGLVQLGQQVCEAEKVKLLQGCQNQYDDCREILQRTEKLHVSVIKEVSVQPALLN